MRSWLSIFLFCIALSVIGLKVIAGGPIIHSTALEETSVQSAALHEADGVVSAELAQAHVHGTKLKPHKPVAPVSHRAAPLKKMIGQMLLLGFSGTNLKDEGVRDARSLLEQGKIGGLIFMGHNLKDQRQVRKLVSYFKSIKNIPTPFIAIDQEGGYVQRLRAEHGFTDIPEAQALGGDVTPEKAMDVYSTMARELAAVGFNVNFGPVVDLNLAPANPIIGMKGRSYGANAGIVNRYASAFVRAHRKNNILTSLKHFPGHGSSWTDSHEQFVDLSSSWQRAELQPYKSLVKTGLADMVMMGHLYHPDFSDGGQIPASLSRKAISRLRRDIGYQGVVITDDLGMGAIKKYFSFDDTIVRSVKAGNDILLLVDDKLAHDKQIDHIHQIIQSALNKKIISIEQIRRSYNRIMTAKARFRDSAAPNL